jgi:hypothetical protein
VHIFHHTCIRVLGSLESVFIQGSC